MAQEIVDLVALDRLELPPTADMHCHLRQGDMMRLVTPCIEAGGCDTVFVMPNLQPPIRDVSAALAYLQELEELAPRVKFLMSLYLSPQITPEVIAEAAASRSIYGIKLYPAGVTTNSQDGVLDISQYYPVFEAMQTHDLVLNLHGEMTFASSDVTEANAEAKFVPQLLKLHETFPHLRIVLEHVSSREGLEAVRRCGPNVRGTITAHHLWITGEDVAKSNFNFCKPIAKTPEDQIALVQAVIDGSSNFFFGSDSAPHPLQSKHAKAAGCFTSTTATALVIGALENGICKGWIKKEDVTRQNIEGFLSAFGRQFYKLELQTVARRIRLEKCGEKVPSSIKSADGAIEVVPFHSGKEIMSLSWLH